MNIEQLKRICIYVVEYGNRPLTRHEKDVLKQLIDISRNLEELLSVAIASLPMGKC